MNPLDRKSPRGGGALLAGAILLGVIFGAFMGQPSVGFVSGLGAGLVLVGLVWWLDRRRRS